VAGATSAAQLQRIGRTTATHASYYMLRETSAQIPVV
jgi:hypothetical protein